MANLGVFIDLRAGIPTAASRHVLAEARGVARALGGTVYAVVATGPVAYPDLERYATSLGQAGADRVVVCSDAALSAGPLWATHAPVFRMVMEKLRPRLFLFPSGSVAAQLAAPMAAELRAAYVPHATLSIKATPGQAPVFHLHRIRGAWDGVREFDALGSKRPIVATLANARKSIALQDCREAELEVLTYRKSTDAPTEIVTSKPDAEDAATLASTVVFLAPDTDEDSQSTLAAVPLDPSTAIVACTGPGALNSFDALCPSNLLVFASSALPWPPPLLPAAGVRVGICAPRKPALGKEPAVHWKTGPDAASELVEALE